MDPGPTSATDAFATVHAVLDEAPSTTLIGPAQARSLFTDSRIRILQALTGRGFDSLQELADHLDRSKGTTSRDLAPLVTAGLVRRTRHGRALRLEKGDARLVVVY